MDFKFDEVPTVQQCGRPTLKGSPCVNNAELFVPGCGRHATEEEIARGRMLLRAWQGGFRAGSRQSTDHLMEQIKDLKSRLAILEDVNTDVRTEDAGCQVVEVDGFAYRWAGEPRLSLHERVVLPPSRRSRRLGYQGQWPGVVTALGTRYTGAITKEIVSRRKYYK